MSKDKGAYLKDFKSQNNHKKSNKINNAVFDYKSKYKINI